jgi:hypothetical protein
VTNQIDAYDPQIVDLAVGDGFARAHKQLDGVAIRIDQTGLLVLVTQIQADHKGDFCDVQPLHQGPIAELPIQHQGFIP